MWCLCLGCSYCERLLIQTWRCFLLISEGPFLQLKIGSSRRSWRGRMGSKAKAEGSLVPVGDVRLVSTMCLVVSFVWNRLCTLLFSRRKHRASALQVLVLFLNVDELKKMFSLKTSDFLLSVVYKQISLMILYSIKFSRKQSVLMEVTGRHFWLILSIFNVYTTLIIICKCLLHSVGAVTKTRRL